MYDVRTNIPRGLLIDNKREIPHRFLLSFFTHSWPTIAQFSVNIASGFPPNNVSSGCHKGIVTEFVEWFSQRQTIFKR